MNSKNNQVAKNSVELTDRNNPLVTLKRRSPVNATIDPCTWSIKRWTWNKNKQNCVKKADETLSTQHKPQYRRQVKARCTEPQLAQAWLCVRRPRWGRQRQSAAEAEWQRTLDMSHARTRRIFWKMRRDAFGAMKQCVESGAVVGPLTKPQKVRGSIPGQSFYFLWKCCV